MRALGATSPAVVAVLVLLRGIGPIGGAHGAPYGASVGPIGGAHGAPYGADDKSAVRNSELYVAELTAQARRRNLASSRVWQTLLHYRPRRLRAGVRSQADGADFFLAADGATDPAAELEATLRAFFAPADSTVRHGEHPQCAFPARYQWLKRELGFDPVRLPEQPCPAFTAWRAAIRPVSLTLVFPEAYMNNPSSMFGHTLIRLDAEEGGERRDLLAYAANFAADTGRDGMLVFAWKGIFGDYPGFFSLFPYYEKVSEYSDWEQRDIWEYELDLADAEIDRVLRHLWELRGVPFFYYFFDENCSYQVLSLLEVARPELRLLDRFEYWAIPADTVRAAVDGAGLARAPSFRPSATTELRHRAGKLARSERALALRIARGAVEPTDPSLDDLTPEARASVLAVAYDYLRHEYLTRRVPRQPSLQRARNILTARSEVPVLGQTSPPVPRPRVRPDEGHGTARLTVGAGARQRRPFLEVQLRPAFHDLLDPQGGYTTGAQIDFLDAALRLYPEDGELRLQKLAVLDIVSLAPRDDLFHPWSWRVNTNVQSILLRGEGRSGVEGLADDYVWRTNGGAGVAYDVGSSLLAYGFAEGTFDAGAALDHGVALGPGAEVGVFIDLFGARIRGQLFADVVEFVFGERRTSARFGAAQRFTLGRHNAIRIEVAPAFELDRTWIEGWASWQWYF